MSDMFVKLHDMLRPPWATTLVAMGITAAMQATLPDQKIIVSEKWLVDIRTVVAVGGVVLVGTWRIARWMKKIEDELKSQNDHRSRIEESIKDLPCSACRDVPIKRHR